MHSSVAAIRGATASARFILPADRQRRRRLGLHRADRLRPMRLAPVARSWAGASPVARLHARHGLAVAARPTGPVAPLARPAWRWTSGRASLPHRMGSYHEAPWRG